MDIYNKDGFNDCAKCECSNNYRIKYIRFGIHKNTMCIICKNCGFRWYKLPADCGQEKIWENIKKEI